MSEENRIVKFIFEQHNRLSCIIRFNNTPTLTSESVAEHSYYVTFLAMMFGDYLHDKGVDIDKELLLKGSLIHDLEEIISGDIIKILKTGEFKKALDKLNHKSMQYLCDVLGGKRAEDYYQIWELVKEKQCIEAKIIDLADLLSCLIYSIKEIHCGNRYFKEILIYVAESIAEFRNTLPELKHIINAFIDYTRKYLADDKAVIGDIESAVRVDIVKEKNGKE